MKPLLLHHPSSSTIVFFFSFTLLMISIINIPTCMCDDDGQYKNCKDGFTCEGSTISTFEYPFWGENREEYCGSVSDRNMKVTCEGSVPEITINRVKYRIIKWDNTTKKLTVARDDYWGGICAVSVSVDDKINSIFENTPFQRDVGVSSQLSLLYNCDTNQPSGMYSTTCGETKVVYTLSDPGSVNCNPTVIVKFPVMVNQAVGIATVNAINQTLQDGFDLNWTGDYAKCQGCVASGGACGNDGGTGFRCFCYDGAYTTNCHSEKVPSSSMSFAFCDTNS